MTVISIAFRYDIYICIVFAVLLGFFSKTYNAYHLGYAKIRNLIPAQFVSQLFSTIITICIVSVAWDKIKSSVIFIFMIIADGEHKDNLR